MRLAFEGYSDDTFGEVTIREDYDNCASGEPIMFRVRCGDEGLVVVGQYSVKNLTMWTIGVSTWDPTDQDDDTPLPGWDIRLVPSDDTPYSPRLEIVTPGEATVERVFPAPEKCSECGR
jgi:hypothetical protein